MLKVALGSVLTLIFVSACSEPADSERPGAALPGESGNPGAGPAQGSPGAGPGFLDDGDQEVTPPAPGGKPSGQVGSGVDTECGSNLVGLIRDFHDDHPDMEVCAPEKGAGVRECVHEQGIVSATLGEDNKPVYAGDPNTGTLSTTGKASFDQWFRDTPGMNTTLEYTLNFKEVDQAGVKTFVFDSDNPPPDSPEGFFPGPGGYPPGGFFPIDELDQDGFRMQSKLHPENATDWYPHNYHFTFEFVTDFVYSGGENFKFTGDDDVFVFINRQLVVDLGGIHAKLETNVDLDAQAAALGLTIGQTYPLHFFFAERHETASNFRIETSLVFTSCVRPMAK